MLFIQVQFGREAEQTVDYSGYINVGGYMPYYTCIYASATSAGRGAGTVQVDLLDNNERTTHEFRFIY